MVLSFPPDRGAPLKNLVRSSAIHCTSLNSTPKETVRIPILKKANINYRWLLVFDHDVLSGLYGSG